MSGRGIKIFDLSPFFLIFLLFHYDNATIELSQAFPCSSIINFSSIIGILFQVKIYLISEMFFVQLCSPFF